MAYWPDPRFRGKTNGKKLLLVASHASAVPILPVTIPTIKLYREK
uniref:Uncharacterized protein n=1 Tax=Arundo donax TaxID=35708 RepID=A0A0A9A8G8_ARUDO